MKLNYLGCTFYALDRSQIDLNVKNVLNRQEAILFNRSDLYEPYWSKAWENIEYAAKVFGNNNVSFHFPVNDCDYFLDNFVKTKLKEALKLSSNFGLRLVVVHSNRRAPLAFWNTVDISKLRRDFLEELSDIVENAPKNAVLALENMPPLGNLNDDAEPLFIFTDDFEDLTHPRVKIAFDINHYFNVVATMHEAKNDYKLKSVIPIYKKCNYFDFKKIKEKIIHWHFSGFDKIANPATHQICMESCLPWESKAVKNEIFKETAIWIVKNNSISESKSVIFEVSEDDYCNRKNALKIAKWFSEAI